MDRMQVEEMRDFFSKNVTYEKMRTILQAIYSSIRGYTVKLVKRFSKKMDTESFSTMWEQ